MFTEVLLAIVFILFIVNEVLKYQRISKDLPPGPFPWPIIGNFLLLRGLSKKLRGQHHALVELSRRYSSNIVFLHLGKYKVIVVNGYNEIQKVLRSEEFDGRPWNEFIQLRNMGLRKGITMTDGPEWKAVRDWLVKSLRHLGFGHTTDHIKNELQIMLDDLKDGGVYRMESIISPATTNVIWKISTGKRVTDDINTYRRYITLMEQRSDVFDMAGGMLTTFPWIRHIAPEACGYNVLVTINNQLKGVLMEVIQAHRKAYVTSENKEDLISKFLKQMDDNKESDSIFQFDQLFLILLDIFIAGTAVTQTTLDFLFLRMAAHQDVQHRLHEELDAVIGWDRLPDVGDRLKLPYTEAVLTESQRLHTIMPIIGPRRVLGETKVNGYTIPKEALVLINLASIHLNPDFYPNPLSFEPERFFKNGAYVHDKKLAFFGRGHRRCAGEPEARRIVFLFFVGIMKHFQVLPAPEQGPLDLEPRTGIVHSPKPYKVLLVPRHSK